RKSQPKVVNPVDTFDRNRSVAAIGLSDYRTIGLAD
ncbi:MAG: hypothetical protein ACI861_002734, partial [Paracoccaceae bacterium]